MGRIEKTIFISYRRANVPWALAIYQDLTHHGYDVFFDYQNIDSGSFEKVILQNIRARAHFLVILTPSALERCNEPNDWFRREIETAIEEKRNIVPLMLESFDFGSPLVKAALTGKLVSLNAYNGLKVYSEYFFEAMDKLRNRFLSLELGDIPIPALNVETKAITEIQKLAASEASPVQKDLLSAQEWFERGYIFAESKSFDEAIRCYSESINLKRDFAEAYNNRGNAHFAIGDLQGAIVDYIEAIKIKPHFVEPYYNCAIVLEARKDYINAVTAYQKYLDLKGGIRYGNQKEVENAIWNLKGRK
ncbi:MAG TPA: tetratricopeptide repeat protein [Anaerolineales bacterium]|nr:tetratricopeptide repeat protein [Anaerolineales bacterium]